METICTNCNNTSKDDSGDICTKCLTGVMRYKECNHIWFIASSQNLDYDNSQYIIYQCDKCGARR